MTANTATLPKRHRITADEYHRMGEAGILSEDDRVELIEGDLIDMSPIGHQHAGIVNRLNRLFVMAVDDRAVISIQNPVRLNDQSEPQPDLVLLKPRSDDYMSATPTAADLLLVVEVADTSIAYDRSVKMPLYARHGIPEAWLIGSEKKAVEVFRDPSPDGYRHVRCFGRGEVIRPLLCPEIELDLSDLFSGKMGL